MGLLEGAAPAADEAEISVFGPGYGECVVAHLGAGQWLINDSCLDRERNPSALSYLRRLGFDPSTSVRAVVASHWHDDHIRGLAQIVEECHAAKFYTSQALQSREFLQLLASDRSEPAKLGSGVREFRRIAEYLRGRNSHPEWVIAERLLSRVGEVEVTGLAPSSATVLASLEDMRALVGDVREYRARVPVHSLNDLSVVLWINYRHAAVLLGGDLEVHPDAARGWTAILDSETRPVGRASIYKVAHHGSPTGRTPRIWKELLTDGNRAVVAPWERGRFKLPTQRDVDDMTSLGSAVVLTSRLGARERRRRHKVVMQEIARATNDLYVVDPEIGHVRLRKRAEEADWRFESHLENRVS